MDSVYDLFGIEGIRIEYTVVGRGEPVLVFHGGYSNCRERFGTKELAESGYAVITPSRAGYGRTSAGIGRNLEAACEAYVQLLDHLRIVKVHVIAISAGGPSGILFASRYPERVRSLTLQSAVTKEWLTPKDKEYKAAQALFRPSTEKYTWKLIGAFSSLLPGFIFRQMASSFTKLPYAQVKTYMKDGDLESFRDMNRRQRSGRGFMIDLASTGTVRDSHLQSIACPTLILHSRHDKAVPVDHAHYALKHIPGADLRLLDTWGHLIWLGRGSEQMHEALISFLGKW
ncbi:alpha/beta hydrolase [Paenibacillus antri]|uniref:Alpha/beta hydrolase n=1 Tax=Paenibacillus antri TaxID=2582848 RepID=A0A5R9GG48_9BACL|nr:alpha/beta hydrolase [Paenibacillus antri]TLS54159.1 alpha/beta hydrolase [Paenibacillus antri]